MRCNLQHKGIFWKRLLGFDLLTREIKWSNIFGLKQFTTCFISIHEIYKASPLPQTYGGVPLGNEGIGSQLFSIPRQYLCDPLGCTSDEAVGEGEVPKDDV